MARGLPYDSDEGRAYAAAITALMTGRAYRKSAEAAKRMSAHEGYQENRAAMVGVIAKHRAAVGNIDHTESVPDDLLVGARRAWEEALEIGEVHGFRNAQATVLAPTSRSSGTDSACWMFPTAARCFAITPTIAARFSW